MEKRNEILELSFEFALQLTPAKEADETEYWLQLCEKSAGYPSTKHLSSSLLSIKKLLNSIITTMKNRQ
jgi:hypothetical protein